MHPVDRSLLVTESADRIVGAFSSDDVALGRLLDMIAMAHPRGHRLTLREPGEERLRLEHFHFCSSVFTTIGANHLSALDVRDQLHPVADAEDGRDVEDPGVGEGNVVTIHRVRSAAKNDACRFPIPKPLDASAGRVNLGVNARFADTARDQLREL